MSRPKTEINPQRALNLKTLIEREIKSRKERKEKYSQTAFAKDIGHSQQNISEIINLKHGLTEETAHDIIRVFPDYRIEWLLGYDDYMTESDKLASLIKNMKEETNLMEKGLYCFLKLYGFSVAEADYKKIGDPVIDKIREVHSGITISRDGKKTTLSLTELRDFQNEIGEYIELRLKHMMK